MLRFLANREDVAKGCFSPLNSVSVIQDGGMGEMMITKFVRGKRRFNYQDQIQNCVTH